MYRILVGKGEREKRHLLESKWLLRQMSELFGEQMEDDSFDFPGCETL